MGHPKSNTKSQLLNNVAIIMDGNGRWAKRQGKPRVFGHKSGVKSVREVTEGCAELGIKYLTLYAFSTENWNRPKDEINFLFDLIQKSLKKNLNRIIVVEGYTDVLSLFSLLYLPSFLKVFGLKIVICQF